MRGRRYLNNIVEQDHRAIKRRCASMLGLKSFRTTAITLAGIELAHRIRKQQFSFGDDHHGTAPLKELWDQALAGADTVERKWAKESSCPLTANAPELQSTRVFRLRRRGLATRRLAGSSRPASIPPCTDEHCGSTLRLRSGQPCYAFLLSYLNRSSREQARSRNR